MIVVFDSSCIVNPINENIIKFTENKEYILNEFVYKQFEKNLSIILNDHVDNVKPSSNIKENVEKEEGGNEQKENPLKDMQIIINDFIIENELNNVEGGEYIYIKGKYQKI